MTDPAALNADIAAILQAEVSEHLAHPPANPESFWQYLAGVIIATPGMQAVISEADDTRAQYQRELQAISLWQERYSARTKTAEAIIERVTEVLVKNENSTPDDWGVTYVYTSQLREALEGTDS